MTARYRGLPSWLLQRLSAIYIALFALYLLFHFGSSAPASFSEWQTWMAQPSTTVTGLLFFGALLIHAWIGLRDVVIDYVPVFSLRLTVLSLLGTGLLAAAIWVTKVMLVSH